MKIRTNKIMDRTLELRGHDFTKQTMPLPTELEELVNAGFRIEEDCILLKHFDYFGPELSDSDFKKTEYEGFLNDIHIDNYTNGTVDEFDYLKIGLEFSKRLYEKLKDNLRTNFRIVVSFSETTYVGQEIETYGGCVVKFHMIRKSCDDKFRNEDLDEFESEGVLEIS